ncbi:unnamed protein product [Prorocentrum cordatum]|uniref:Uncharacterized protein n=1 Tax=Prorocentrum cordatum TaxID=2364126 RepID=A0ABN9YBL1_9DINO|nr:unnamed protein product [Polarella glacialis]
MPCWTAQVDMVQCSECAGTARGRGRSQWLQMDLPGRGRGRLMANGAALLNDLRASTGAAIELPAAREGQQLLAFGTLEQHRRVAAGLRVILAGGDAVALAAELAGSRWPALRLEYAQRAPRYSCSTSATPAASAPSPAAPRPTNTTHVTTTGGNNTAGRETGRGGSGGDPIGGEREGSGGMARLGAMEGSGD